jgi:ABC-type amino acid transport substrate-binding protein
LTIDNEQLTIEENVLNNTFATVLPTATTRQPTIDFFHCPLSIVHCQFTTGRRSTTGASQKTCHANFCSAFIQERKGLCFQAFGDKLKTNTASVLLHLCFVDFAFFLQAI